MAGNLWDAEIELDAAAARDLLAAQFPQLALDRVEPLAAGWDNAVFVVDDTWAVRFPRRAMGAELFNKEVALLPDLAPQLPLAIPVPEVVGHPQDGYPWPFWGGRLIPGAELADAAPEDRTALGTAMGGFLKVLHGVRDHPPLPTDPMYRAFPAKRGFMARDSLDRLAAAGTWSWTPAADALLTAGRELPEPPGPIVLSHGDLHMRHVLIHEGAVSGVIDWGDACLADPAVDLSFAYGALDGRARDAFFAAYGATPDADRELRARVLALGLCGYTAEYAVAEARPALLREALAGLARAAG